MDQVLQITSSWRRTFHLIKGDTHPDYRPQGVPAERDNENIFSKLIYSLCRSSVSCYSNRAESRELVFLF